MKSFILSFIFLTLCLLNSQAQGPANCNDPTIHRELVSVNQAFEPQGFTVNYFKTFSIGPKEYVPLVLSLKAKTMYQINFIAHPYYKQYSMVLIDKDKKELLKLKVKSKDTEGHMSTQSFVAPYSGEYYIIFRHRTQSKSNACVGFSVLEAQNQ